MPSNETYVGQILEVISAEPEKVVLWWHDQTLTAAGLGVLVRSAAQGLRRCTEWSGRTTDAVVAVLTANNTAPTLVLRYAANLIGATVVHLHTTNAVDPGDRLVADAELKILRETGATHLAVDGANVASARALRDRLPTPLVLVGLGELGPDVVDLTAGDTDAFDLDDVEIRPDHPAVVTYTSGTTGEPKGIAVDFRTRNRFISAGLQMGWRSVYLSTMPLSHSSGATADDSLASGGSVILQDRFDADDALRAIQEHRITRMLVSPPHLYLLMDHPEVGSTDLSSLQMVTYLGCPASPERLADAVKIFGQVLIQVYGTSEAGFISMLSPADHLDARLRTTVGRPLPGWVRIRDVDDHHDMPAGETGEVCVQSPFTMKEYVGEPELTARTVRDGWVYTGDLGFLDSEGYLSLRGRMGEVMKTNGIKIHPVTVENAFLSHPDIAQACVFCVRDRDRIEYLHAAVVLREGATATVADLADHIRATISPKHVPAETTIRTELPLTGVGKPDKARLAAEAGS
ncbi:MULTISPECIES: class I adenylate-forming enzyme family protein [Streptomyces]|uniref:Amide synthetase n=1 Tax=Streptomyces tsukubensis (strain DSM 42081 / NBRC 108919 / NRRL 18488 / 9993) TaxID=1114943 RepID=I2NAU1_STRT9|nr:MULTISPECIES: AMP-binding protein [Streptomyces]AZK97908.1 amide synthetase [Streptomyces tsukubensis]EIF94138.1 amide synthetase [Streptomyces tsukubensis NRRL18488]MYS68080.1 AMP-binding protein [Streptomyces sp. SID5473]QKM66164.1 amide synthetase [Streptomyces tsukubensis NRRL18488]TAI42445.1 amide synthetase [Streptomyces tsukubensis]